jgi:hypothetical protein
MSGRSSVEKHPRRWGCILAFVGAALLYWKVYLPLQDATAHVAHLTISRKATVVGITALSLGLLQLAFGGRVSRLLRPQPGDSRLPIVALTVLLLAFGFAVYHVLQSHLEALGYQFHTGF